MQELGSKPVSDRPRGRRVSRRGVLVGLAATPLVLEVGRASLAQAAPSSGPSAAPAAQAAARTVHSTNPPLEESPLGALEGTITPTGLHFIRNHAPTPDPVDLATWRLTVDGEVDRPLSLSLDQLRQLPSASLNILIECAGNSRSHYDPPAAGTQWGNGAVSVAEWTGVPLSAVLELAGMRPSTVHVIARGFDAAKVTRGLPTAAALRPDVILAWALNGEPLPISHGFPLRLVVPGWLGVANVKWLDRITASPVPNEGLQQTVNYVFDRPGQPDKPQMTLLPVKSVIARPAEGAALDGTVLISGFAWSGSGSISAVEVSADGGLSWTPARLLGSDDPRVWRRWDLPWTPPASGQFTLLSRATDSTGQVQPVTAEWNRLGYAYNAIQGVHISVNAPASAPAPTSAPAPSPSGEPPAAPLAGDDPGKAVYAAQCARCHGDTGKGMDDAPEIIGPDSVARTSRRADLLSYIRRAMPYDKPGTLSAADYEAVTDYLIKVNK
jgi:DMSO/TMAO reductase YedYZ molybdopterin-dependent catalytic subunit/mono/diheme cytochrome c family protein